MKEDTFLSHLIELRQRLLWMIGAVLGVFIVLLPFSNQVYALFAQPVLKNLLAGQSMLAQDGMDVFLTPIKVCLLLAFFLTVPFLLYQIWQFVAPALWENEKKMVLPLLLSGTTFFYLGVLFAYWVVLPLMFRFFSGVELEGVQFMPDINRYVGISMTLFIAFGLVFEVPVALFILVYLDRIHIETLKRNRPYVILAAFTLGMVLTPPDIISQTLLAIPLLLMFELGLLLAQYLKKQAPIMPQ